MRPSRNGDIQEGDRCLPALNAEGDKRPNRKLTLVLEGDGILDPKNLDAWFEAGYDDATFGEVDGVGFADFARRGHTAPEAILFAIDQIASAVPTIQVIRVEPDDLVNASDIAGRLGRTRESVRSLIARERGPGGFPAADLAPEDTRSPLAMGGGCSLGLARGVDTQLPGADAAVSIAALNDALDLRRLSPELEASEWLTSVAKLFDRRLRWDPIFAAG